MLKKYLLRSLYAFLILALLMINVALIGWGKGFNQGYLTAMQDTLFGFANPEEEVIKGSKQGDKYEAPNSHF
jgi:hypothetical protein